ncbi:MAG TPA: helix-turn-helix domain-containing protein [Candidatus Kapabacteria bacterium]|nr:helix-turn-helix domain-containing protein [Candidatus Kapabacteria bacterium]
MKNIAILVPRGAAALSCIEGSVIGFGRANEVLASFGKPPLFQTTLVGIDHEPQTYDRCFSVRPDVTIGDPQRFDLIIIPAVNGNWNDVIGLNQDFFPWIIDQYKHGAEVASLCVGAFLLAATGLADGKKCATHWMFQNDFRKMFPNIDLVSEKVITDEHGVYSSGGASSFWNLILYLIDKYAGRDVAIACAKIYEIEIDRNSQSQFIIFSGQKDHEDEPIKEAQAFIEQNFQKKITVNELASMCAMGRRTFERRFKKATSNTVVEYLQRVKIEAAKRSLEHNRKHVAEIMYDVGYSDTKAFRTTFKKITGLSPVDYRNKYV